MDTCSFANMKKPHILKATERFGFFAAMTPMLADGHIAFPRQVASRQVASEMLRVEYLDTPGDWVVGVRDRIVYPEPSDEAMAEVLGVASNLLDAQSDREQADPYVVAMAYDIGHRFPSAGVVVVSDDVKDRMPRKESVLTACNRLGIGCWQTLPFVDHIWTVIARTPSQ